MKITSLIPARAGSKRLTYKNIKLLGGKPLLFWSIDVALEADCFCQVAVSSDSDEILNLVRNRYSPSDVMALKRPPELASDSASLNDVCVHYLEKFPEINFLSLMMPTYPFRTANRINEEIIPPLYSRQIDRVTSVRYGNYSTFDYWIQKGQTFIRMYHQAPLWCGAGNAAYFFQKRAYFFLQPYNWPYHLGERTLRIQNDYLESVDIDTPEDFLKAEKICSGYLPKNKPLAIFDNGTVEFIGPQGADLSSLSAFLHLKEVRLDSPVLILRRADPSFTFLRWYECNSSRSYLTENTEKILADLPISGHSQDFPVHFSHSPYYRVLRKHHDENGVSVETVPQSQVILEDDLIREWKGYVEPIEWIRSTS